MKPQTVDEYIASFPADQAAKLTELRKIIQKALPDTTEALKWNAPAALDKDGMILVVFSGHKQHMNIVGTPTTKAAFEAKLTDYETGKGSFKLQYDKPLPTTLIEEFVLYRAEEYRENGVKWM
ncbi:hypothetical protein BH09PAT3_BH09PAT3_1250 [soil metagenome]